MLVHTDARKRWFGMLLHRNSCLLLSIKKGETVEITFLWEEKSKPNLEDILIMLLIRYYVSKNERFLIQHHTSGI